MIDRHPASVRRPTVGGTNVYIHTPKIEVGTIN